MEKPGDQPRNVVFKEVVQVTYLVGIFVEHDLNAETGDEGKEVELILGSNRRPLPIPYSEEP